MNPTASPLTHAAQAQTASATIIATTARAALAVLVAVASSLLLAAPRAGWAADDTGPAGRSAPPSAEQRDQAFQRAWDAAQRVAQAGPVTVPLADQAQLALPAGHRYVPEPEATALLNAMGNPGQDKRQLGLVMPEGGPWFAILRYEPSGHIPDDEARTWDTAAMLQSYKDGTAAGNDARRAQGVPPIEVLGWAEVPHYEAASHQLVWAMSTRHIGDATDAPQGVNYNTYLLGREGYLSLNLVTGLAELPAHKPAAQRLLGALQFTDGHRYDDFDRKTDKVAEYGLAALVVGAAAKKLGLLAVLLGFGAKFAKILLLGLALLGGGAARLFKRQPKPGALKTDVKADGAP